MKFPCTSCGACCRRVAQVPDHGLPVKDDGSCGHLVNNLCSIYHHRPDICRVDKMVDDIAEHHGMDRIQSLNLVARLCNSFQEEDGMDKAMYHVGEII